MIHNFSNSNSVFNSFIAEMRDIDVQKDSMRFRKNLERIAEIMAYEVSKKMEYTTKTVTTPLGESTISVLKSQPVLATILRAGLGMHNGLLHYFDKSESAFVSAFRKHTTAEDYDIYVQYMAGPGLDGKTLIISDPMLATGSSMVTVYRKLLQQGTPSKIFILSALAHQDAIDYVQKHLPSTTEIWVGAIDSELTAQSYIVPGMGDVGDLAYGTKL